MKLRPGTRVLRDGERLTPRQAEVVKLLDRGLTNGQIADELGISLDGAKFHVTELMNRYGVHSHEESVAAWRASRGRTLGLPVAVPFFWSAAVAAGALTVVVIAVWVAVINGSGPDSDRETDGAASARFTMHVRIETPGKSPIDSVATGVVDFENKRMAFRGPDGAEQLFIEGVHYQRLSQSSKWRKFESSPGTGVTSLTSKYWNDRMNTARDVEELGDEVVVGELARHYRFTTDYPISPGAQQEVRDLYRDTSVHFDLWLASDGRLIQFEQTSTFENTGDAEIDGQTQYLRMELSGWNEPVDIRAPDPSEIEKD